MKEQNLQTSLADDALAEWADRGSKLTIDLPDEEKLEIHRLLRDSGTVPKAATFYLIGQIMIRLAAPLVRALPQGADRDSEIMRILADVCQQHGEVEMEEICRERREEFWRLMEAGKQWFQKRAKENTPQKRLEQVRRSCPPGLFGDEPQELTAEEQQAFDLALKRGYLVLPEGRHLELLLLYSLERCEAGLPDVALSPVVTISYH